IRAIFDPVHSLGSCPVPSGAPSRETSILQMTADRGMNVGTATGHFGVTTRITRVGFADGWTGAVAIGTILYVVAATYVTLAGFPSTPGLDFYMLVSDWPGAIAATLLAIVAARKASQPVARLTWKFLAAALVTY